MGLLNSWAKAQVKTVTPLKKNFYQLSFRQLEMLTNQQGLPLASAALLFNWHYKKNKRESCSHHNFSKKAKFFIEENFIFNLPEIDFVQESQDKTVKFLFRLHDEEKVETVLIPFQKKYTVCLSSQVGCAMNCSFCHTGQQGFRRNLTSDEIVGQFLEVQKWLSKHRPEDDRILNIVYMGQGEPLHNFDEVKTSAEIFLSQHGVSLAGSKITISTSGYLPGLQRWKKEMPNVNIALSLHSAFNEKRNVLIPLNRRFPLEQILNVVDEIPSGKKRFVTYEYLLVKDFNDSFDDAEATGRLLQGKKAYINLIPFNPIPGSKYQRPSPDQVMRFKGLLDKFKIPTTIRTTKGDEIMAACGQLNTQMSSQNL